MPRSTYTRQLEVDAMSLLIRNTTPNKAPRRVVIQFARPAGLFRDDDCIPE